MSEVYVMVTFTGRERLPDFLKLYKESHAGVNFVTLGRGTANSEILDYLGLEEEEKAAVFSVVTDQVWLKIKRGLQKEIQIDIPGTGIAFVVPMSSIGGKRELLFLTENQGFSKGEETVLKDTAHELLIVIANQGYNEKVMQAARKAGATGGTSIHARGTGMREAEKFFGVSLATEKEIILIVTKTEQKNDIMKAIMDEAGMESKAKSIVFSLPVTSTAGLRLLEYSDSDEKE